jgi:hypothetical protein
LQSFCDNAPLPSTDGPTIDNANRRYPSERASYEGFLGAIHVRQAEAPLVRWNTSFTSDI